MPGRSGSFIGTLARPHGVSGELRMNINPAFAESIEPGIPLFVDIDGQRVPFFIEEAEQLAADTFIIRLEFTASLEEAKKLCGFKVYNSLEEGDDLSAAELSSLSGFMLIDEQAGVLGEITSVIDNSMNPLFEIRVGEASVFAPAATELIIRVDRKKKTVTTRLPEGIPGLTD